MVLWTTAALPAEDPAPVIQRAVAVDSLEVARVPADYPVGFCLLTHAPYQYVCYYNLQHRLSVAQRKLTERKWTITTLPDVTGYDTHNYIALTADEDGFLHLSADMHVVPLKYFRTTSPWDASTFKRIDRMTGTNELRCTYPQFLRGASNVLLFTYRDGGSGNGNQIFDSYDLKTQTWRPFLDAPLTDGQGTNSAYFNGPVRGPDGWFHLAWIWRATSDAGTCHDLSYARSRDLQHWETSGGRALALPIRFGNCEIIDPVPKHGGMINGNTRIGFDTQGRVSISYHKNDTNGNTQPFVARLEDGKWILHQVTDWPAPAKFSGTGSLPVLIHLGAVHKAANGSLLLDFKHFKFGQGTWVLDPQTLRATGKVVQENTPPDLNRPTGNFEGLVTHWSGDEGTSGVAGLKYQLRWETLEANHDRPRQGALPEPSMLQVIAIETKAVKETPVK